MDDLEYDFKPSYIVVAIDTHPSMFNGTPSSFKNCLRALYRLSDALLLRSDKGGWSPFSVVFNDEAHRSSLINFKDNMINTTKMLKEKSALSDLELRQLHMRNCKVDLAELFQLCKKKFKDISSTFHQRILIFISDDDDPVNGDATKRFTALNEAKNFEENDIIFQLVVSKHDFNFSVFYNELFSLLKQPKVLKIICEDEEGIYEKLASTVWFRHSQRKLLFYPFLDDHSKYFTVYKKSYLKPQRLLNNDFVAKDGTALNRVKTNEGPQEEEAVASNMNYILTNKATKAKFEELSFTLAEKLESEQNQFPIGYTLLYACHRLTGLGDVITEPRIIEADAKEELPFFKEFWQYCVNNDKVLICIKKMKANDQLRCVELIPKLIHGNKVFLAKSIPYANEVFEEPKNESEDVPLTDEQRAVTDSLIEALKSEFEVSSLVDEVNMRKKHYIKAKLLEEDRSELPVVELPEPKIDKSIQDIVHNFLTCFPQQQGTKRKKESKN